jgi:hypothetical protein
MRLEDMTLETFAPFVGSSFTIRFSDREPLQLKMTAAEPIMERVRSKKLKRQPFTVYFEGPDSVPLPQQIYEFSHEALGDMAMFIVPTGREDGVYQYEAVFT